MTFRGKIAPPVVATSITMPLATPALSRAEAMMVETRIVRATFEVLSGYASNGPCDVVRSRSGSASMLLDPETFSALTCRDEPGRKDRPVFWKAGGFSDEWSV
jgi:hypothetical protein